MYEFIHTRSDFFIQLSTHYQEIYPIVRREYLFGLKIGEMTGYEYEEFIKLIWKAKE